MAVVEIKRSGDVALVTIDHPPVNALSQAVRSGLSDAAKELGADAGIRAVVITGAGRCFSAGADITEFGGAPRQPPLFQLIHDIEALGKPVVAAMHGTSLGGGFEIVLGCHYRIADKGAKMGLPEVKIGLIPGAGGTQRLPRAVGVAAALDMIVSGNPIDAATAQKAGLVDRIAKGDLVEEAIAYARELIASGAKPRRLSETPIAAGSAPADLFEKKRASLGRHPSGKVAPNACIDAVEAATKTPFAEGMRRELELFMHCYKSPEARALWHVFFAERAAAVIPDIGPEVKPRKVESVGVIGAGTMGQGIAMSFANAGIPVTVVETAQEALDRGIAKMRETYESAAARGRMSETDAKARFARLTPSLSLDDLKDKDLIIEAVFESMKIKKEVFGKLDGLAKPGAVLASNTSTLDVDEIALATSRPGDVVGMHFFSPANIMRLLEVVRGAKSDKDAVATAMGLAKRIGKIAVLAGVCDGFIGNRMLASYGPEAQALALEGATPSQIDKAISDWGLAMGPFAMGDLAGNDVGWRIRQERALSNERKMQYAVNDKICEMGRFGQKTGRGFYIYEKGSRTPKADPEVEAMYVEEAKRQGIARRAISDEEIVERLLFQLVNAGAELLGEGIALRASDIDTVYVNGYGFPAWRGGPMWSADVISLKTMVEKMHGYEKTYGPRFTPAPLLARLAAEGKSFNDGK
ncbi:short chain enoyl-CoA hydratase /3-hydroxyacyl-CoA dehydrogenase [Rhizobiales bacterium GAS113]|nr:short chain enoyl-CoA hydratase /3-hydroxyacyl-CoA dehydrogenase [Rhizobiales bacterium GAS113]